MLALPGLPEGGDVYDWLSTGGGPAEKLWTLVEALGANGPAPRPIRARRMGLLNPTTHPKMMRVPRIYGRSLSTAICREARRQAALRCRLEQVVHLDRDTLASRRHAQRFR